MIEAKDRKRALGQARQLDQIDAQSAAFKSRLATYIRKLAIQATKDGTKAITLHSVGKVEDLFLEVAVSSYLQGVKSERDRKTILLSLNSRIAKSFSIDLGNLRNHLRTVTGQSLRRSLGPLERRINNQLADISSRGLTGAAARRQIVMSLYKAGVATGHAGYIDTLVRTHSQFTYNAARWQTTIADDDVWGYKYINTGTNVRPSHEALNGTTRLKTDPIWGSIWPPNGWNCKCQIVVLYEKQRQTRIPTKGGPDDGFEFNGGVELNAT